MRACRVIPVVFAAACGGFIGAAGSAGASAQRSTADQPFSLLSRSMYGVDNFRDYCAPCHGRDGKGHGPVALALKTPPADLTTLAARNGGAFPRTRVREYITNGSGEIQAHGTVSMPVWGPTFRALDSSDRDVNLRIANLVEYLATIQQ